MIEGLAYKAKRQRTELWLTGASPNVAQALRTHGLAIPLVQFADTVDAALEIILVEI